VIMELSRLGNSGQTFDGLEGRLNGETLVMHHKTSHNDSP
jgi:hypothetical protein